MGQHTELLKGAKLPERTVSLCLRGDLVAVVENLEREWNKQQEDRSESFDSDGGRELQEKIVAARQEMETNSLVLTLRALKRRRWDELIREHQPREDNTEDQMLGYNPDSFHEALVRECTFDPVLDVDEWEMLLDALSHEQWRSLAFAALFLNTKPVNVPFSYAASQLTTSSGSE